MDIFTAGKPWIGVDLDGVLAVHDGGDFNPDKIGLPVPEMVARVKKWLEQGLTVKIFTARVDQYQSDSDRDDVISMIRAWCKENLGSALPVVNTKDRYMLELWDDRSVSVRTNTGEFSCAANPVAPVR